MDAVLSFFVFIHCPFYSLLYFILLFIGCSLWAKLPLGDMKPRLGWSPSLRTSRSHLWAPGFFLSDCLEVSLWSWIPGCCCWLQFILQRSCCRRHDGHPAALVSLPPSSLSVWAFCLYSTWEAFSQLIRLRKYTLSCFSVCLESSSSSSFYICLLHLCLLLLLNFNSNLKSIYQCFLFT